MLFPFAAPVSDSRMKVKKEDKEDKQPQKNSQGTDC